jgi:hypothetical protein
MKTIVNYREEDDDINMAERMDCFNDDEIRSNIEHKSVAYTCLVWALIVAVIFITIAGLFLRAIFN